MKKWVRIASWGIGGTIGVLVIVLGIYLLLLDTQNERDNRIPARQTDMIQTTLEWARLAPFPQEAQNFNIQTEGSALTRTFKGSFSCSEDIIISWVEQSPGIQDAEVENISETKIRYIISPGGGANYAEVVIDYEMGKIEFRVSWS